MIIRKNILPRTLKDFGAFTFVICIIPIIYCFELIVVLPTFYPIWSFLYNFNFIFGNFIAFNVITNFVAMLIVDTSVKGRMMPTELKPGWRFCCECESIVPPRSWHCETCRTCILKRDHHCFFAGCCIGHENSRYFMMFCMYILLATAYSLYFNTGFIWHFVDFKNKMTILKMIFPLAMLVFDNSLSQIYLLLYLIVVFVMVFAGVLVWFHTSLILNGQVTHEKNFNIEGYCYTTKKNIEIVFGVRWYLTWISPFINSKLPHDGINWEQKETVKTK